MDEQPSIDTLLRHAGLSSSGIDRIKLGSGVVGKLTTMQLGLFVICFAVVGSSLWFHEVWLVVAGLAIAVASFLYSSVTSLLFAKRYPSIALLEGAELVRYHQIEMGAKEARVVLEAEPNVEAPRLPSAGGGA